MSLENRQGGRWGREAIFISEYQPCTVKFYKEYVFEFRNSPLLCSVFPILARLSKSRAKIILLIGGQTGTGA